ncbi:AfsR/SARP family transcriptional regulator [Nakamurella sp.]|uniref:AfsR/SARP family transcriptional regulator n=1 Tax=Nakamurella sp. TaxID=1869182 RepID=UPI0037832C31
MTGPTSAPGTQGPGIEGPGIDLLGPVRIRGGADLQTLTRRQEIGVLALLALHAGSAVPAARLVDLLWPDDPPRTATKTLQGYIKRVRGLLADTGIGLTHTGPAGYLLDLAPAQVDAVRFESLVASARTGHDDDDRVRRLDSALALWRGEPFGGCDLDGLRPFREWLERLRSGARVERAATDIKRGITSDTIGAVRGLVTQEPTNERLWLHLVAALYLSGNPVAALTTTAEARRELDERVGATPGPELLEIEHRIGVHDDVEGCYARLTGVTLRPDRSGVAAPRPNSALSLPIWAGELIGRDVVVDEIVRLIDTGAPVLTVAGAGGLGKTRCAAEGARRAITRCEGLIDLSGITTGDDLAVHLAGSLGAPGRDDPVAAIADQLAGRRCCVLLDNAEQVAGGAAVIGRLALQCPTVTWLVTSRAELGLAAEQVVRLAPLPSDSTADRPSAAARLLTAAAGRRGVELSAEAAPVIDRVVAAIGGIPLALELAACQLQALNPAALLRSLDEPLTTLVDRRREVDRHRSMRACVQLGLDRLSPAAVTLMALLSERAGGAPYDDLATAWESPAALSGVVAELVENGFAETTTDTAGAIRVTQLPLMRAFGRELTPPDDPMPLAGALDAAVLARAAAVATGASTASVEPDLADVRRLLQFGMDDDAGLETALGLAAGLVIYWWSHRLLEGRGWLDALLKRPVPPAPSVNRLLALNAAVFLDYGMGDAKSAQRRAAEALACGAPLVPPIHSMLLSRMAVLDAADESTELARSRAAESMAIARAVGAGQVLWSALGNCGDVAAATGDPNGARELYLECIDQLRRAGITWLSAAPCARLGDLELSAGHLREARMWFDRSLALWLDRELGAGAGQALAGAARLEVLEGRLDEARNHLTTGLAAAERSGSRVEYPFLAIGSAALAAAQGDAPAARALFAMGLSHGKRSGVTLRPMVEAELATLYRATVGGHPERSDEALALATPLEDLPAAIRKIIAL